MSKPDLVHVAAGLQAEGARQLAYEMAAGICDADGAQGPAERDFLQRLAVALHMNGAAAAATSAQDNSVADAALELLSESIASIAIIPLKVRLVYRIGKSYGYPMDANHARDFIATLTGR